MNFLQVSEPQSFTLVWRSHEYPNPAYFDQGVAGRTSLTYPEEYRLGGSARSRLSCIVCDNLQPDASVLLLGVAWLDAFEHELISQALVECRAWRQTYRNDRLLKSRAKTGKWNARMPSHEPAMSGFRRTEYMQPRDAVSSETRSVRCFRAECLMSKEDRSWSRRLERNRALCRSSST
jgi:hypothetical protein